MTQTTSLELLIATSNAGKAKEIKFSLSGLPLRLRGIEEFREILIANEFGDSYADNAIIKATSYASQTGLYALADDSGLEIEALGGAPGVRSSSFGGDLATNTERINLLLSNMLTAKPQDRRARFVCVMALADPTVGVINITEGMCGGRIAMEPAGDNGFGFDPVFIADGYELTFAQMPWEAKTRISHRAQALSAMRQLLGPLINARLTAGLGGS